jgi:hypothetical protein
MLFSSFHEWLISSVRVLCASLLSGRISHSWFFRFTLSWVTTKMFSWWQDTACRSQKHRDHQTDWHNLDCSHSVTTVLVLIILMRCEFRKQDNESHHDEFHIRDQDCSICNRNCYQKLGCSTLSENCYQELSCSILSRNCYQELSCSILSENCYQELNDWSWCEDLFLSVNIRIVLS